MGCIKLNRSKYSQDSTSPAAAKKRPLYPTACRLYLLCVSRKYTQLTPLEWALTPHHNFYKLEVIMSIKYLNSEKMKNFWIFRLCRYSAEERAIVLKAVDVDVQQRTGARGGDLTNPCEQPSVRTRRDDFPNGLEC